MENLTLSEFNGLLKKVIAKHMDSSYWIVAEIGELNVHAKGHCYMEMIEKEGTTIKSKMRATIWSYAFGTIHQAFVNATGMPLKSGMKILFNASPEFHEVFGLSLNIRDIDPSFTLGERQRKKQETIRQLEQDGIMDLNKSLILPLVPQRIAIISSPTAAGYGDFCNQIDQNPYGYAIKYRLFSSIMQGEQAVTSILGTLHRIHALDDQFDLVIVIRGGGSQSDLDCFDDYELCAHLAQFPLPVITGIGHERDQTICDLVANISLKTPTAVAEFIISGFMHFENEVNLLFEKIAESALDSIGHEKELLVDYRHRQKLKVKDKLNVERMHLEKFSSIFNKKPVEMLNFQKSTIHLTGKMIDAHDPVHLLQKGFTLTKVNGKYLIGAMEIKSGDHLETITSDQTINSKVV